MMRRLLAFGLVLAGSVASGAEGPRLVVEPGTFDFGRVRPGAALRTTFSLTNAGAGTLVIERISSDCGCTVVDGWRSKLSPGEATEMRLTLKVFQTQKPGPLVRRVTVKSNDVARGLTSIDLRAEVVSP
jgi:hypothetical protein